ncbi:MAG TPA: hypothetical protein VJM12_22635 [Pyrinomonadaceae bacterium]|nr:hypothetical protein [Pyrinomonadaceae bacterium]
MRPTLGEFTPEERQVRRTEEDSPEVFTFSYFVPTMVRLINDENMPQAQAVATAVRWGQLNYLRHAIVLVAWLLALKAFSMFGAAKNRRSFESGTRD